MTSKTKAKAKDKEQSKRFIKKAREIEADESSGAFERAFKKIVPPKPVTRRSSKIFRRGMRAYVLFLRSFFHTIALETGDPAISTLAGDVGG